MNIDKLLATVPVDVKNAIEEITHKAGTHGEDWVLLEVAAKLLCEARQERDQYINLYFSISNEHTK